MDIEIIIAVALKELGGKVWTLPKPARHSDLFAVFIEQGMDHKEATQGFITSTGRFVNRKEGWKIARAANQILSGGEAEENSLVSEDLW